MLVKLLIWFAAVGVFLFFSRSQDMTVTGIGIGLFVAMLLSMKTDHRLVRGRPGTGDSSGGGFDGGDSGSCGNDGGGCGD